MSTTSPKVSICIPHWQVQRYMAICLRSIWKYSAKYNLEILVVDNGSRDSSLDYLRSLSGIRLIERPEEVHTNFPTNVFTAWDSGIQEATGEYFITMHSDVFVRSENWLDPFLDKFQESPAVAGVGAWKLNLDSRWYTWQKEFFGDRVAWLKQFVTGRERHLVAEQRFPRDYCAMYRRAPIFENGLQFNRNMGKGGGYAMAKQLWNAGYHTRMIPVTTMMKSIVHVAHGTAAISPEKPLHHRRAQKAAERRVTALLKQPWIVELENDRSLDQVRTRAAA